MVMNSILRYGLVWLFDFQMGQLQLQPVQDLPIHWVDPTSPNWSSCPKNTDPDQFFGVKLIMLLHTKYLYLESDYLELLESYLTWYTNHGYKGV